MFTSKKLKKWTPPVLVLSEFFDKLRAHEVFILKIR